jgi:hypothetical protein
MLGMRFPQLHGKHVALVAILVVLIGVDGWVWSSGFREQWWGGTGTADATVLAIRTNSPQREVFTVQFTTLNGESCRTEIDSGSYVDGSLPLLKAGEVIAVRYGLRRPCKDVAWKVPHTDTWMHPYSLLWPQFVGNLLVIGFGAVLLFRWRYGRQAIGRRRPGS